MARKDRDNRHTSSGEQTDFARPDEPGAGETVPVNPEDSAAAQQSGTTADVSPEVDTATGEMKGQSQDAAPPVDVIHMPKKIVAKEIVPRGKLKGGKKWVPGRDPKTGDVLNDGTGVWELDPPRPLYTVFGTASGTETGTTNYGDWVAFTGNFEAVRAEDGVRFKSNVVILQEPASSLLLNALQDAKTRDKNASLSFAFNVGIRTSQRWVDSNEGTSYEYTVESVINVERTDPLAYLRNSLQSVLPKPPAKQLAGPGSSES